MALKAAVAIGATGEALDAMTGIAAHDIAQGETQAGADVLAYVLRHSDTQPDTHARAAELFEDLETRICPRVILDAREFAIYVDFEDMLFYVLGDES